MTGVDQIRAVVEQLSARAQQVSFDQLGEIGEQAATPLQQADAELQKSFVLECLRAGASAGRDWARLQALKAAAARILRRRLPWRDEEVAELVRLSAGVPYEMSPVAAVLRLAEGRLGGPGMTDALGLLRAALAEWEMYAEARTLIRRIDELRERSKGVSKPEFKVLGPWTRRVYGEISESPHRAAWAGVIQHASALAEAEPPRKWRDTAAALAGAIGREEFRAVVRRWLLMGPAAGERGVQVSPEEGAVQRGLLWFLPACADGDLCGVIAGFAEQCLRKIPNLGAVSQKAGHACVHVLAAISGPEAVAQLSRLSRQFRYQTARRLVGEALEKAATAAGVSREELEEMTLPTFGLDTDGRLREEFGDVLAEVVVAGETVTTAWMDQSGGRLKSMPARLRESHAEEVKELRATIKNLETLAAAQRRRLERLMWTGRQIPFERWRTCYLEHPLVRGLAQRLIWEFTCDGETRQAIWHEGRLAGWAGEPVKDAQQVRLWHPLHASVQDVLSWRCWLEDHDVRQPFKQAHREVYLLTPAERETRVFSRRFAGHILRQHVFAALARERGWQFRLMGGWDSHNTPLLELPEWNLRAELAVEFPANETASSHQVYLYIHTGEIRFRRPDGSFVPLEETPAVAFSEVLRDVDLFVSVASVGADPEYGRRGGGRYAGYWQEFAFGELSEAAEGRRALLERLLPKLAIASRCRLEGRYLVVQGERALYKIHLGSGNVLAEPGSRYLCIVQGGGAAQVSLPFEGDPVLSVILSKAFLLADDRSIKDRDILAQLPAG